MDNRTLLAIALSMVILLGFQYIFSKTAAPPPPAADRPAAPAPAPQQRETPAPAPSGAAAARPPAASAAPEKEVTVENNLYTAVFTSRGGTIKSITLKHYKDKNGVPITLRGSELVPPLALGLGEAPQFEANDFSVSGGAVRLSSSAPTGSIIFERRSGDQTVRRTYVFSYDKYGFDLKDEVGGVSSYWVAVGKDFGIHQREDGAHAGPVILQDADRKEFDAEEVKETRLFKEHIKWVAQEDKYFIAAIVPRSPVDEARVWSMNADALAALKMPAGVNSYFVYAGPKELGRLAQLNLGLEHAVDFGFFSILARPLFWVLKFLYDLTNNYGVAIILLTILTRIPFIPLITKSQKSMKKLQDIQPRMTEIREKYKNDPQRMQRELMELYKKHKVNPVGGCLPMLLQVPVFFALYQVLNMAIELRNAPFMLWVTDLSAKDPYFVLPIAMGATMLIQQKMTPSTMDPMQQKIMLLMPVVFTFMFLTLPSGLVLFWLVGNILSIIQQFYINRSLKTSPA